MLDEASLRELFSKKAEAPKVEFKLKYALSGQGRSKVLDEVAKDIIALTNTAGRELEDYAYLILGIGDELKSDGTREREDVRQHKYDAKLFLTIANARCNPSIPDIHYEEIEVDGNYYGVVNIPPSPHMHTLTRDLDTPKGVWRKSSVLIRHGDEVAVASFEELEVMKREKERTAAFVNTPQPNIVCLGEDRLFVIELDGNTFRESDDHGPGALRPVAAEFTNAPKPPQKVASVSRVSAQVIYFDADWPDRELYRVNHACWLNEESPYVSFNLDTIHHVIVGTFQHKKDGTDGFEPEFTIYGNSPNPNPSLSTYPDRFTENFKIKVRLIIGEHGEFTSEHDFELEHTPEQGHSFGYVSDAEMKSRKAYLNVEFLKLIAEGEEFATTSLIHADWDKLYEDIHKWTTKVSELIDRHFGKPLSIRFYSTAELKPYPHRIPEGRRSFLDELYTRIANLREIAREQGAAVFPSDVSEQVRRVCDKRREVILTDLSEFVEKAKALFQSVQGGSRLSWAERDLYVWDAEIFDYLSDNLDRDQAAILSDSQLEQYAPPDGTQIETHNFLHRVYTRMVRLNRLTEEIRSGDRTI